MANFVEAVNWCSLRDIGFIGPKFTWLYERSDGSQIRERLDRALATTDWINVFPMAPIHHLTSSASDHSPLVLRFGEENKYQKRKKSHLDLSLCGLRNHGVRRWLWMLGPRA